MPPQRKVVIVTGRCTSVKQGFGIRFELEPPRVWHATWAFAIKDAIAKNEGYDQTRIEGKFVFDPEFPGCPHCATHSFFLCGCGKTGCWDGVHPRIKCAWCHESIELGGEVSSVDAGGDR